MADWKAPEGTVKGAVPSELEDSELNKYHDQMHVFWDKITEGHYFGWSFKELYIMHKSLVIDMMRRNIGHIHPVNDLDEVSFAADIEELTEIINRIQSGDVISN